MPVEIWSKTMLFIPPVEPQDLTRKADLAGFVTKDMLDDALGDITSFVHELNSFVDNTINRAVIV
jgi:hypothetical protein